MIVILMHFSHNLEMILLRWSLLVVPLSAAGSTKFGDTVAAFAWAYTRIGLCWTELNHWITTLSKRLPTSSSLLISSSFWKSLPVCLPSTYCALFVIVKWRALEHEAATDFNHNRDSDPDQEQEEEDWGYASSYLCYNQIFTLN